MSSTRVVPREQIKRRKKWPNILACKWMSLYPPNHPRAGYISPATVEVLLLASPYLYQAAKKLNKNLPTHFYTLQLLQRNYQIAKKAHTIYAFGILEKDAKRVKEGTGWTVQLALDERKEVYLFDIPSKLGTALKITTT